MTKLSRLLRGTESRPPSDFTAAYRRIKFWQTKKIVGQSRVTPSYQLVSFLLGEWTFFFPSSAVRTNLFLAFFFFPRAVSGHLNLLDAIASRPFKWFMILWPLRLWLAVLVVTWAESSWSQAAIMSFQLAAGNAAGERTGRTLLSQLNMHWRAQICGYSVPRPRSRLFACGRHQEVDLGRPFLSGSTFPRAFLCLQFSLRISNS